jgi:hypothetical protein
MVGALIDRRVLMSSLAGFLADADLTAFYGNSFKKSNHPMTTIAKEFFNDSSVFPLVNLMESLIKNGAGPALIHNWSIALNEDLTGWEYEPIFPSFVPDTWKLNIIQTYPSLVYSFYNEPKVSKYLSNTESTWRQLVDNCKANINWIDKKYSVFHKLEQIPGLKDKELSVIPLPLDIGLCGSLEVRNKIFCTLGNGYRLYDDLFNSIDNLEGDIEVIIHEFFHCLVHEVMKKEGSILMEKVAETLNFNEHSSAVYSNATIESQVDETITQALTIGWIKLHLGDYAYKNAIKRAINNGFIGSIKVIDLCLNYFSLN